MNNNAKQGDKQTRTVQVPRGDLRLLQLDMTVLNKELQTRTVACETARASRGLLHFGMHSDDGFQARQPCMRIKKAGGTIEVIAELLNGVIVNEASGGQI